jgi:LysR family transcriptional regulator, chromosome initiation inhibitor
MYGNGRRRSAAALAAQTALLESEAMAEMGGSEGTAARIALAVNADSLATWFTGVFSTLGGVLFDIRIEDQDQSTRLLREGVVMGAVTTERAPVPGYRVQALGVIRYIPVASKAYIKRHLPDGLMRRPWPGHRRWPGNRDDALQDELVRKAFRRHIARPQHFVPTAEGFGAAVRAGLGWGMFPDSLAASHLADGSFVRVSDVHLDVPLFWQCWKLNSPLVQTVTDAVESAAASLRRRPE